MVDLVVSVRELSLTQTAWQFVAQEFDVQSRHLVVQPCPPPIDDIRFVAGEKLVEKRWGEVNRVDAVAVLSFWGIVLASFMNLVTLSHTGWRNGNRQVNTPIDTEFGDANETWIDLF